MIEASKTAEPSSQPTKRERRAWLIALAVVVAVVTIVLLTNAPKPEPVKVWFVRATNEAGVKKLVFEGTNGTAGAILYVAEVITNQMPFEKHAPAQSLSYDMSGGEVAAGKSFNLAVMAPPKGVPYYLSLQFLDMLGTNTPPHGFKVACYKFLCAHGMFRTANYFTDVFETHFIPSTEIKE